MMPSSAACASRYISSACSCTQAIDVPGRMSWNWWSSTRRHRASSSSYGYACPPRTAAVAAHSSASRSSASARRLPRFVRAWLVYVPRWFSRYNSPRHTGRSGYSRSAVAKKSEGLVTSTRGEPSRSRRRLARSIISLVGPPPPSPKPNGASERPATPFSAKFASACASSRPVSSQLYVSTGGKWVRMRVPSMPSQSKVWCGSRFTAFHESFCVRNQRAPASFASCGYAAL
ncbi:hypothetical protein GA0115252_17806 [Streptomyces sp. DfronAA-171]|nr:hypothetical protein GA0115252_17806 [Streptomyces sp. DfronAA-171]